MKKAIDSRSCFKISLRSAPQPLDSEINPHMKLHSFRQDLQDYQDFFGLVWLYPVHPVDPDRKINLHFVKFFIRSDWTLATRGGACMKIHQNGAVFDDWITHFDGQD